VGTEAKGVLPGGRVGLLAGVEHSEAAGNDVVLEKPVPETVRGPEQSGDTGGHGIRSGMQDAPGMVQTDGSRSEPVGRQGGSGTELADDGTGRTG